MCALARNDTVFRHAAGRLQAAVPKIMKNTTSIDSVSNFGADPLFLRFHETQQPVGGDSIEFAERDHMADRNLVLSVFIFAVLLLCGVQDFGDIQLTVSPLCTDDSDILNNTQRISLLFRFAFMLHLI